MDEARRELGRILSYLNPHGNCIENDDPSCLDDLELGGDENLRKDNPSNEEAQPLHSPRPRKRVAAASSSSFYFFHPRASSNALFPIVTSTLTPATNMQTATVSRHHRYLFHDSGWTCPDTGDSVWHRFCALHLNPTSLRNFCYHLGRATDKPSSTVVNHAGVNALHILVARNAYHVRALVDILLLDEHGCSPAARSLVTQRMHKTGTLPLHLCTGLPLTLNHDVLHRLLSTCPATVHARDSLGDTALSLLYKNVLRFQWARQQELTVRAAASGKIYAPATTSERCASSSSWMTIISPRDFLKASLLLVRYAKLNSTNENHGSLEEQPLTWHDVCDTDHCPPLMIRMLNSYYQNRQMEGSFLPTTGEAASLWSHSDLSENSSRRLSHTTVDTTDVAWLESDSENGVLTGTREVDFAFGRAQNNDSPTNWTLIPNAKTGMYPLHYACRAEPLHHRFFPPTVRAPHRNNMSRIPFAQPFLRSTVSLILQLSPVVASLVDATTGRLPLHWYISGRTSTPNQEKVVAPCDLWDLVVANPAALSVPDPITGLYPAQQLALGICVEPTLVEQRASMQHLPVEAELIHESDGRNHLERINWLMNLELVYEALLADPSIISR
jgi:hypothetical protein